MKPEADAWGGYGESERIAWLAGELTSMVARMRALEHRVAARVAAVDPAWRQSAENLAHYLALRHEDVRALQTRLSAMGLSSLGRSEPHVLTSVGAVLGLLERLARPDGPRAEIGRAVGMDEGRGLLTRHADELFGAPHPERRVRIMVTMPGEAADDPGLVRALVIAGMDVMRVNCAHDDAAAWRRMVAHLRAANDELHTGCRVQFDLPGPKLRTGEFVPGPAVLHWRPLRDARGNVVTGARVRFEATTHTPSTGAVRVASSWLEHAAVGRHVRFTDLRGKPRVVELVGREEGAAWGDSAQSAWVGPETEFVIESASGRHFTAKPRAIAARPGEVRVSVGQRVRLVGPSQRGCGPTTTELAVIPCTLPEALAAVRVGHRVSFDDGKLGGVVEEVGRGGAVVRLTEGPPGDVRLGADKGINLPDTHLPLPALGEVDLAALDVAAECADLVALSFARTPGDVAALHAALDARRARLGVVLKVENREGFENLSGLLLAAMRRPPFGVMIARGDLAVECGFARLAELQEEMLCLCEAAHAPVVWATQVLETAARKGFPSRAEVTDAAVGERAECVMLNKGPFVTQAVRTLDDILRRMESHQSKKTPLLRRLRSLGVE